MSGATYSKVLVLQMQRESMRQRGTSAVRRTLQKMGLQDATFTAEAVAAVKASAKARMGSQADARLPVEWYRKDGQLLSREYEAPSVRSRMTDDALAEVHSKVHELGKLRLANPALEKSRKSSLKLPELKLEPVTWMLIYVMAFTVLFLAFCVLGLIWGGLTWNATHPQ